MEARQSSKHCFRGPGGKHCVRGRRGRVVEKSAAARAVEATHDLMHELESLNRQLSADPPEVRRSRFRVVKE